MINLKYLPLVGLIFIMMRPVNERTDLVVKNYSDFDRTSWPVTMGIPFPEGELMPEDDVTLHYGATILPLQTAAISKWWGPYGDGSVRWLLLDFQTDLQAGEGKVYQLKYPVSQAGQSESTMTWSETQSEITVDTGAIKLIVNRLTFNLLDQVWLDENGDGEYSGDEKLIEQHSLGHSLLGGIDGGEYDTFSPLHDSPEEVTLETTGSEKVVILAKGKYRNSAGVAALSYLTRIKAFRGKSHLEVSHTFIHLDGTRLVEHGWHGDPTGSSYFSIDDLSLTIPLSLEEDSKSVTFSGTEAGDLYTGILDGGSGEYNYLYQDGDNNSPGQSPTFEYEIAGTGGVAVPLTSGQNLGWVDISDGRRGMTTAVRNFWQQHPKGIELSEDGTVSVKLYPSYAEDLLYFYVGTAKTHDILFYFHTGDASSAESEAVAASFQAPLRAVASRDWYTASMALDKIPPNDPNLFPDGPNGNPNDEYTAWFEQGFASVIGNREGGSWGGGEYGIFDFGDDYHYYHGDGQDWGNLQYDMPHALFLEFARTGSEDIDKALDYLERAVEQAGHYQDVDIIHFDPNFSDETGAPHGTPNHNHEMGYQYAGDFEFVKCEGLVDNYFLTGNNRSMDVVQLTAEHIKNRVPSSSWASGLDQRRIGWCLICLTEAHKADGNPDWIDTGSYVIDRAGEWQDEGSDPDGWEGGVYWQVGLLLEGFADFHRLTGDSEVLDRFIRGLDWQIENFWSDPTQGFYDSQTGDYGILNMLQIFPLGYAWEQTDISDYLEKGEAAFWTGLTAGSGNYMDAKHFAQKSRSTPRYMFYMVEDMGRGVGRGRPEIKSGGARR